MPESPQVQPRHGYSSVVDSRMQPGLWTTDLGQTAPLKPFSRATGISPPATGEPPAGICEACFVTEIGSWKGGGGGAGIKPKDRTLRLECTRQNITQRVSKICLGILMVFIFYFHFFSLIFFFCHIWRKIYIFSYFRNILTFDFTVDHLLIVKIPKEPLKFSF